MSAAKFTQWSIVSRMDGEIVEGSKAISANCVRAIYKGGNWFGNLEGAQGIDAGRMIGKLNCFDEMYAALDSLVAVVGLTAFKRESQRAVLQEAIDNALAVLKKARGES